MIYYIFFSNLAYQIRMEKHTYLTTEECDALFQQQQKLGESMKAFDKVSDEVLYNFKQKDSLSPCVFIKKKTSNRWHLR